MMCREKLEMERHDPKAALVFSEKGRFISVSDKISEAERVELIADAREISDSLQPLTPDSVVAMFYMESGWTTLFEGEFLSLHHLMKREQSERDE